MFENAVSHAVLIALSLQERALDCADCLWWCRKQDSRQAQDRTACQYLSHLRCVEYACHILLTGKSAVFVLLQFVSRGHVAGNTHVLVKRQEHQEQ